MCSRGTGRLLGALSLHVNCWVEAEEKRSPLCGLCIMIHLYLHNHKGNTVETGYQTFLHLTVELGMQLSGSDNSSEFSESLLSNSESVS